ncbi:MAG: lanthionine synthetase C family protein [Ktedonobacteraceae bacterium]|nr:lanthionine synthetase C family protein [Ktedonobacteraceae bacterium]
MANNNMPSLPTGLVDLAHSLRNPPALRLKRGDEVGLANGLAGIALLPLTLAPLFPEQGWLDVAGSYFARIAQETRERPLSDPGLYHGCCGIAFTLSLLAQQDCRYHNASQALLARLVRQVTSWDWRAQPFLPGQQNFEVIGGVAGILRFLLTQRDEPEVQSALGSLLAYLIWVSEEQERWPHRPERLGAIAKKHYPQGYLDLGLAHGLAGPLAALSLAVLHDYVPSGLREAIERWSTWLVDQQLAMPWGKDWPSVVPLQLHAKDCSPTRSAWCYGTPGIARALWLAGRALADDSLCALAREALASTLRRPAGERNIDEPQICHGVAGLLLICLHFAHDDAASTPGLKEAIPLLTTALCTRWIASYAQMSPGFLTGAVGGALTLIAALTNRESLWDQVLLLS